MNTFAGRRLGPVECDFEHLAAYAQVGRVYGIFFAIIRTRSDRNHDGFLTDVLEVRAGVILRFACEFSEGDVRFNLKFIQTVLEKARALGGVWQGNVQLFVESSQKGKVEVPGSVRGHQHKYAPLVLTH